MRAILHGSQTQKAGHSLAALWSAQPGCLFRSITGAISARRKRQRSPLLRADVRHIFRKSIFLFFAECPGRLEMIVVDERVHRVMHVPSSALFRLEMLTKSNVIVFVSAHTFAHRRLVASHTVVR